MTSRVENKAAGNEPERSGSSDAKSPGLAAGSIPSSSTEKMLVKAKSLGQLSFSSRSHQHPSSKLTPWRRFGLVRAESWFAAREDRIESLGVAVLTGDKGPLRQHPSDSAR